MIYTKLKGSRPIGILSSLKLTVIGLAFLFLLVLLGTIHQSQWGLYSAQQKYFYSWFILLYFIPLPGAQLVFSIMAINLLLSGIFRIPPSLKSLGLYFIHAGLLLLLFGGLQANYQSQEMALVIMENEESNQVYINHEFLIQVQKNSQILYSKNIGQLTENEVIPLLNSESLIVTKAFLNSQIQDNRLINKPLARDFENNNPGVELLIKDSKNRIICTWQDDRPLIFDDFKISITRPVINLPFSLKLLDFQAEFHPGTNIPSLFSSLVILTAENVQREAKILMNQPLRYDDYTIFQSSYSIDENKRETSIFNIVKNPSAWIPYAATFIILFGLVIHFILKIKKI